ncbi:YtpR family tRNA-binding protein [Spiroplasma diminutum]|uniref:Putative tRNA-binding protein n=1 Tax=Spiroplasma diminutum CUAS-1 TaxID=1276221 RepID=S5MKC5_9MOLU|nr:tRNA-binding protein [Spiroplasma diminutum]AGR42430.1 putative tRNA-binding protein [Spiroplasma diminutum CUAS-1]
MKLFLKYIKSFKTIAISFNESKVTRTQKEKDYEILFNNDQIIGLNIFNFQSEKSFSLEDNELQELVRPYISKYFGDFEYKNQFIIAKVVECEKIPDTHLSKCKVNTGAEEIQVICGASNVKKDIYTTLATVGSWMPDGSRISQGKLKGFDSFGMLCSAKELEIVNENYNKQGIMEWDLNDSYIGKSIWEVLNEK